MHETSRLLEAAAALSQRLHSAGVPHAFYGSVLNAVLSNAPQADEIYCIVEGGGSHPFKRVRQACTGTTDLTTTPSPWSNRLHATYHGRIPPIDIEILPAGEEGPRRLDGSTVVLIGGIPFLTISEFLRAKLKAWAIRQLDHDAQDIIYALTRYWDRVDINRIPEQDMRELIAHYPAASPPWKELRRKYSSRS
ncbi:hypothetical protein EUX98_g3342 [Antrodiella citrinella]|uniref:Uncharacterized protein n=1 Tax=Antrodiella citrinella TaxID=2447956 RepID=A0A4V3XIX6_9APHY|nr:hypothetical protein EUX98_g3342 [Antrodiella citrinella]